VKRDGLRATVLWVVLTVIGEIAVLTWSMLPKRFSEEADAIDEAYVLLMALGVPVFAFVITILLYSAFRFRVKEGPAEDGPPLKVDKRTLRAWLAVTGALAVFVIINPGFVGLAEIRGEDHADLVVSVAAQSSWTWTITYEGGERSFSELVLPVGKRVRFDITAPDPDGDGPVNNVLHSFWIPSFRVKIDAVPGRTTHVFVTPTDTGTGHPDDAGTPGFDVNLRVQCAELCGIGHSGMMLPVRVVPEASFGAELAALR
jgi:cytochrome c oxidase subunit 2